MTIGAMKDLIVTRLAVGRYKKEISIAEASKLGSKVKIVREEVPAEEGHSVVKKRKSDWLKIINEEEGKKTKPMENEDEIRIPMKSFRGADGELVLAYLSSLERCPSRLRPRKEVPSFRMVDLEDNDCHRIVGKRVKVYWSESRKWFTGHIKAFDDKKRLHTILYDDGDKEELELSKERFELEIMPTEDFRLIVESISKKKVGGLEFHEDRTNILPEEKFKVGVTEKVTKDPESKFGVSNLYEEFDESKTLAEIARESTKKLKKRTAQGRPSTDFKKMWSDTDDTDGSEKTKSHDSMYLTCGELLNRFWSSKKRMQGSMDMKNLTLLSRKEIDEVETLDEEMEVDLHNDGLKKSTVHSDINVKEAAKANHQQEHDKTEALDIVSESNGDEVHEAHATALDLTAEDVKISLEDGAINGDMGDKEKLAQVENITASEDAVISCMMSSHCMKGLPPNVEASVQSEKMEVMSKEIDARESKDVDTVTNQNEKNQL